MDGLLINIPMAYGETLKADVIEGLSLNDCEVAVFSSQYEDTGKEKNKANNVRNALEHNMFTSDSHFFLMDSDVILPPDSIREVSEALIEHPVVTIPTKLGHTREDFPNVMPHALMAIRSELVDEFKKYLYKDGCFVCAFLKDYKPFVLWNCRGNEI